MLSDEPSDVSNTTCATVLRARLCAASGKQTLIDPWYDYLALPIAPLVLVAQFVALFLRRVAIRTILLVGAPLLISGMLAYVSSRPVRADEGVNIGAGVLVLWLGVSLVISLSGGVAEMRRRAARKRRCA